MGLAVAVALAIATVGCENDNDLRGDEMYLSPSSYTCARTNDFMISFGLHGAVMPVSWSVSDSSMGRITGVSGSNGVFVTSANYERVPLKYGVNTVIVRDARGWQVIAPITVKENL